MDRREFIRSSLQLAIAAAAIGGTPWLDLTALASPAPLTPPLAVRKGKDIPTTVRAAVTALGGMSAFVKAGEVVVVKPNIGWDRTVELAANTHPLVVRTVVELCLEAGAKKVLVFDRTCNDPRRCYVQSGIAGAVEGLKSPKVSMEQIDRRAFIDVDIKGGIDQQRWSFYQPALDADRFINLPIAKHHSISTVTVGMKNIMGVIGGNRGTMHRNIAEALADINTVIRSDLTIVDATRILVANGPQGGQLKDVKILDTIIASPDIVAADAYSATLFGLQPRDISFIVAGAKRGLGTLDLQKVRMV
ncbi:MAG: cytoplasmic protein [Deltaproteobacteria bacterium HGW-Deltaproteobacteria-4]|nr:MAG: cytoplasmic protein [Deltaproteobacteria bacterium HGW-Deltaproteobacteria-4]